MDYHLIGSLQDLQAHFHLSQLHLPKETISVVTDTRYVFQPIIRLSKTKGKIEVVIKVGSQFVQVTTTKKQEVVPGLRLHATVNDIFRLSEVDEAPTSIQTEDDSAFGLRTENGKIVMYFTSPRKPDVLQAIRGAKAKYGKELRTLKSFERLVRPQDVPGTLLNIALTNMASADQVLRLASYNLLCALCRAFRFAADSKFMSAKGCNHLLFLDFSHTDRYRTLCPPKSLAFHCRYQSATGSLGASAYCRLLERIFCRMGKLPVFAKTPESCLYGTLAAGSKNEPDSHGRR